MGCTWPRPQRRRVDFPLLQELIPAVPFFIRRISAILLLALWLPATLHCSLENVGLFPKTCADDCAGDRSKAPDGCGTVEDGSYRPAGNVIQVNTPDLYACLGDFYRPPLQKTPEHASVIGRGEAFFQSQDWIPAWQFVRRLAPLSRAPSLAVA
jgi:hypothetical protein